MNLLVRTMLALGLALIALFAFPVLIQVTWLRLVFLFCGLALLAVGLIRLMRRNSQGMY
jgi:hypothetical protein